MIGKLTPGCTAQLNSGAILVNCTPTKKAGVWAGVHNGPMHSPTVSFTAAAARVAVPPDMFDLAIAHAAYLAKTKPPVVRFDGSQVVSGD